MTFIDLIKIKIYHVSDTIQKKEYALIICLPGYLIFSESDKSLSVKLKIGSLGNNILKCARKAKNYKIIWSMKEFSFH